MSYPHSTADCDEHHDVVCDFNGDRPAIVVLCGSTRFYDQFQQANYDLTMKGEIVLSVCYYPHAKAGHGQGGGVGHDSAEKAALDELHKRKIDLADRVLVVSDETGYFGQSTESEIRYAIAHGKPLKFAVPAAEERAADMGLLPPAHPVPADTDGGLLMSTELEGFHRAGPPARQGPVR